ncbi:MAG: zinc ribbon domain-containing protein [Rubrivivax sp.]|nr:zinc ribbon domain-containing protein [Pyrinomonadaceae bacterium]
MFCPRCSQQASDEVRFCSRCGFPLDEVAGLIEGGGLVVPRVEAEEEHGLLTPRQRGMRKGLLVMAGGLLFFGLAAFLSVIKDDFMVFMPLAVVVFTYGVIRMLYGMLLEDDAARAKAAKKLPASPREKVRAKLDRTSAQVPELPPARSVPASVYTSARANTSDMAAPPSVTESTTRLLEEDK